MEEVDKITVSELSVMARRLYGDLIKAVVDIESGALVVDAEMHADEEQYLLKNGSRQNDLWGINLYPGNFGSDDFIEFESLINIRPSMQNRSLEIKNEEIRQQITTLVMQKVTR